MRRKRDCKTQVESPRAVLLWGVGSSHLTPHTRSVWFSILERQNFIAQGSLERKLPLKL